MNADLQTTCDGIRMALGIIAANLDKQQRTIADVYLTHESNPLAIAVWIALGEIKLCVLQIDSLAQHVKRLEAQIEFFDGLR